MKSTGIVRPLDQLGRVVIPIELRRTLDFEEKESLEIMMDGNTIVLRKHSPTCYICGGSSSVKGFKGKLICIECVEEIRK